MIPFIIRDDDLSYFTSPELIDKLYGKIWDDFPITFAAVPLQKGAFAGHIPMKYWHTNEIFPIGDNKKLISFLKPCIEDKKIDIVMHGIHHTYRFHRHRVYPELIEKNDNFYEKLISANQYLKKVFSLPINIFVPPSNTMSKTVYSALNKAEFNLLNLPGVRVNSRPLLSLKHQWSRFQRAYFHVRYGIDSPIPIRLNGRWELGSFVLTPSSRLESLKSAFLYCYENSYPFVLATHYWEHNCYLNNGSGKLQYDSLIDFLEFVSRYKIKPMLASSLVI